MSELAHSKEWQRERALVLHRAFDAALKRIEHEDAQIGKTLAALAKELSATLVCGKFLRSSPATLRRAWDVWKLDPRPESLIQQRKGFAVKTPAELVKEFQRRCTLPGCLHYSVAMDSLEQDWKRGEHIPGLGDRFEWCNRHGLAPDMVPDFPIPRATLYRWKPSRRVRALGTKGVAAAKQAGSFVDMDYSKLRKCELFTLDDVRLDIVAFDTRTGQVVEVVCYILMEVASRSIVAWVMKPAAAIKQEDVDELLAYGLQTPGYGIGVGYTTHIKFERGTVACSEAAQMALEGASGGRIKIHRTTMNGGVRWVGAPADRASGNFYGKAVIESFNRKLHLLLMDLPGQRGNKYENQPANLGLGLPQPANPFPRGEDDEVRADTLIRQARQTGALQFLANGRAKLSLPMLTLDQLHTAVEAAIKRHNTESGHEYSGHGFFQEAEVAPGVWQETA